MIRHIVMWNLRGNTLGEKAEAALLLKKVFEELNGEVPGLRRLEIGIDISRTDYACDVVLYSEFDSREALDNYAFHPAHLRAKAMVGDLRIARHQVDYLVSGRL
ncbi:Dabb family protein [Paraburkholderia terrae]|uniref:Dabb family protein n=1 Tax=Paraburkholderia terrae TaxID=311230 RepID=UPI0030E3A5A0